MRNSHKILFGKPEGKILLGRPKHRCIDGRIILQWILEIGLEDVGWIHLAQDRD
jgi:hypothetical protein